MHFCMLKEIDCIACLQLYLPTLWQHHPYVDLLSVQWLLTSSHTPCKTNKKNKLQKTKKTWKTKTQHITLLDVLLNESANTGYVFMLCCANALARGAGKDILTNETIRQLFKFLQGNLSPH